jgi:RNA polymerase sigma factor (sigma-70 family)
MLELTNILEGCKQNDRLCQEKLYLQFYPAMFNLCNKFFDDNQDIVTAINNGMLRVFKNISQFDSARADIHTWVYTIVRNAALTQIRDKKTKVKVVELTTDIAVEDNINPFKSANDGDVFVYLGKLTATTRAVCSLFYIEDYSIKEISTSLEMKEGTVKWHLCEGRNKLKMIFQNNLVKVANAK